MDKFADYMWYLLHAPFKKISKTVNQWYILLKVLGKRFDRAKDAVLQARDESMIATCGEHMLMQIGRERGLGRYENEDIENYRRRIALYPEVCRLGGTNEGIILAVKSLGYTGVDIVPERVMENSTEHWAEFYVLITMGSEPHPIGFTILTNEVRKKKEVGAKDNYKFITQNPSDIIVGTSMTMVTHTQMLQEESI